MRHAGTVIGLACDDLIEEGKKRLTAFLIAQLMKSTLVFIFASAVNQPSF